MIFNAEEVSGLCFPGFAVPVIEKTQDQLFSGFTAFRENSVQLLESGGGEIHIGIVFQIDFQKYQRIGIVFTGFFAPLGGIGFGMVIRERIAAYFVKTTVGIGKQGGRFRCFRRGIGKIQPPERKSIKESSTCQGSADEKTEDVKSGRMFFFMKYLLLL